MHYFLDPHFDPQTGILSEEESRHAMKSLRVAIGDHLEVGNGRGELFVCAVGHIGKRALKLDVLSKKVSEPNQYPVSIAIAPTKNTSRFEWFLEKATELGVDTIIPIETKRTERIRVNAERAQRIAHAAAKQSQRSFLPEIKQLTAFPSAISGQYDLRLMAHCDVNFVRIGFREMLKDSTVKSIIIFIGPEGDFTSDEIEAAQQAGFSGIDFGTNRLRTETAGVFAASVIASMR